MATGNWLLGGVKGKVGDIVLSKANGEQITRARNRYPKNPKTTKQAMQRMSFAALSTFYTAFEDEILNHSWQGIRYGGKSHNHFYKLALSPDVKTPAIPKGSMKYVPSNYPMSRGTLRSLKYSHALKDFKEYGGNGIVIDTGLNLGRNDVDQETTLESFINTISDNNPYYAGKQLTFVIVTLNNGNFINSVSRIVLDKNAYTEDDLAKSFLTFLNDWNIANSGQKLVIDPFKIKNGETDGIIHNIVAYTIIVSDWDGKKWCRSNENLVICDETMPSDYFDGEMFSEALKTYMNKNENSSNTSDRFLNGAGNVPEEGLTPSAIKHSYLKIKNFKNGETTYGLATVDFNKFLMSDGSIKIASSTGDENGNPLYKGKKMNVYVYTKETDKTPATSLTLTWKEILAQASTEVKNNYNGNFVLPTEDWYNLPEKSF